MSNLLAALTRSGSTLSSFDTALAAIQNNLANMSTLGYARQRVILSAQPFDVSIGLYGGVLADVSQSARDPYAEAAVRYHSSLSGSLDQVTTVLKQIDGVFGTDDGTGIRGAMNRLFDSFANWSTSPNGQQARQTVITEAKNTAQMFQQTSAELTRASQDIHQQIGDTVTQINGLASQISAAATALSASGGHDAGAEARFYAGVEQLSQLADVTVTQSNGTYSVYLGGQVPLVVNNETRSLPPPLDATAGPGAAFPGAPPTTQLLDADGNDITAKITKGKLGGLLQVRNEILPRFIGSGEQQGDLNRLAQSFATKVNDILTSGSVSTIPPVPGGPLFFFDTANPVRAAATLALDPSITADTLAAIQTNPASQQNGIPLQLAALRDTNDPTAQIDGMNYGVFAINMSTVIGQMETKSGSDLDLQNSLLLQAQNMRQQTSGVSLEQESVYLLQFQRSYQATSNVIKVIDDLTQSVLGLIR